MSIPKDRTRPNIVVIVADDMGYGDCGCYGSDSIETPNIDALAEQGVRFTDFHSNGAVCSPTRAALLTGRYQQRSGIEGVVTAAGHREVGLPADEMTFGELLHNHGYATGVFGKWHVGYQPRFNPTRRGFDEFHGFVSGNIDYRSHIDQVGEEDWWQSDELVPEEGYTTDLVTEHGVRFIEANAEDPFCLYLAHECPHYPYQGPDDPAYRTPGDPEPVRGPREDKGQAYREMMESMDAGIGRVMDTIRACGIEENTMVFFFSDNGPAGPGSAGPLRGRKGSLWEGGHRVPAVASWPGVIPAGTETDAPCMGMDLFPTMMELAGIDQPDDLELDGSDLMPVLTGDEEWRDRCLFWRYDDDRAIRCGRWKLVDVGDEHADAELFDLRSDLSESTNLAPDHPDIVADLSSKLAAWEQDVSEGERLS